MMLRSVLGLFEAFMLKNVIHKKKIFLKNPMIYASMW